MIFCIAGKFLAHAGDPGSIPRSGRSSGEGIGYPFQCSWTSLVAQLVKNLPAMRETWVSIPGLGRSPGEGNGYPLQYSGLENSMDCIVHGVTKSRTQLSDFHFTSLQTSRSKTHVCCTYIMLPKVKVIHKEHVRSRNLQELPFP